MPNNTVVCIGDSLTYGINWLNGSDLNQNLNARLSMRYPGLSFINLGVNGDSATGVYARRATANIYTPFRIIVWIGIADVTLGHSAATIETDIQSIYTYYNTTMGYEVYGMTITPRDDDTSGQQTIKNTVNTWIKTTATGVSTVMDAWTVIRDPNDPGKRLPAYADPNTPNHMNDAGLAAIVATFPTY